MHDRIRAVEWSIDQFGISNVDFMNYSSEFDIENNRIKRIAGFWFAKEKDAVMFSLRWS